MILQEVISYLESVAPPHLQESYDNSGLIIGNPQLEIKAILFSLDATEDIIREAIKHDCNVVICHHPIIFGGLRRINGLHYVERAVITAIKHDIAIYAIHTNLDNVLTNGVNEMMAIKLGLNDLSILKPRNHDITTGAGLIGHFMRPIVSDFFLEVLKEKFQCHVIRHTKLIKTSIQKVALCGGSGAFLIKHAIEAGADAFITADVKYHEFFEANDQIIICDLGHFETEQYTIDLLFTLVSEKFTNFASRKAISNTNPVNYY